MRPYLYILALSITELRPLNNKALDGDLGRTAILICVTRGSLIARGMIAEVLPPFGTPAEVDATVDRANAARGPANRGSEEGLRSNNGIDKAPLPVLGKAS